MRLALAVPSASGLGTAIAEGLDVTASATIVDAFPDGEIRVLIDSDVRGADLHVLAPEEPPLERALLTLTLLADAGRRAGAARVTALIPYLPYARQDRRTRAGEPVGARVVADLIGSRVDRVIALDLHSAALEGFFLTPLEHISALAVLAEAVRPGLAPDCVVVSPDLGAVKLAEGYARVLGLNTAVVRKVRVSPTVVRAAEIVGEVRGRSILVVDDMISTGATIEAAVQAARAAGAGAAVVVATHGLFVAEASRRLAALGLTRLVVTDSLPLPAGIAAEVVGVGDLFARAIKGLRS